MVRRTANSSGQYFTEFMFGDKDHFEIMLLCIKKSVILFLIGSGLTINMISNINVFISAFLRASIRLSRSFFCISGFA